MWRPWESKQKIPGVHVLWAQLIAFLRRWEGEAERRWAHVKIGFEQCEGLCVATIM
jgi:hypothetical protein